MSRTPSDLSLFNESIWHECEHNGGSMKLQNAYCTKTPRVVVPKVPLSLLDRFSGCSGSHLGLGHDSNDTTITGNNLTVALKIIQKRLRPFVQFL